MHVLLSHTFWEFFICMGVCVCKYSNLHVQGLWIFPVFHSSQHSLLTLGKFLKSYELNRVIATLVGGLWWTGRRDLNSSFLLPLLNQFFWWKRQTEILPLSPSNSPPIWMSLLTLCQYNSTTLNLNFFKKVQFF